jgi:hypothetical protein
MHQRHLVVDASPPPLPIESSQSKPAVEEVGQRGLCRSPPRSLAAYSWNRRAAPAEDAGLELRLRSRSLQQQLGRGTERSGVHGSGRLPWFSKHRSGHRRPCCMLVGATARARSPHHGDSEGSSDRAGAPASHCMRRRWSSSVRCSRAGAQLFLVLGHGRYGASGGCRGW